LNNPADVQMKHLITASINQEGDDKALSRNGYGYYLDIIRDQRPKDGSQYELWARHVLEAFDTFRLLSALRQGSWGVENLNQRVAEWLFDEESKLSLWYEGRPVMITRNDYNLGLMNGDIGIALRGCLGKLQVAFPNNDVESGKKILWISPMRLPDAETAFAMTVHKSQGSEFNHVALILPETKSPVLTRELIYTAITRAKHNFTLVESHAEIFNDAILVSCK
jgi:exodeoxyribonuclease V alpha subunit